MTGPRDLPDMRHRDDLPPFDEDDDGIAGYLPELRDERVHRNDEEENEDEAGL